MTKMDWNGSEFYPRWNGRVIATANSNHSNVNDEIKMMVTLTWNKEMKLIR